MAFMDYLPQFSDNVDQAVDDPTLQVINLKRKLALADSLRNTPELQGQMVSGHFVAPSWTQALANAVTDLLISNNCIHMVSGATGAAVYLLGVYPSYELAVKRAEAKAGVMWDIRIDSVWYEADSGGKCEIWLQS